MTIHTFDIATALCELGANLEGELITPEHPDYAAARTVWNGRYERHPAAIARCRSAADISTAVAWARANELPLAVRAGGHSAPAYSLVEGGLVIDLRPMRAISVDPQTNTVRAEAGALAGELSAAAQAHGLAVPVGTMSQVGIGGLTLGGGIGWLLRKHGLTIDNLLAVELVTAEGQQITASPTEHADLFWALRGGGGNFGVATAFTYKAHPAGPLIFGGPLIYSLEQAAGALRNLRELLVDAPDELSVIAMLMTAPLAPPFPPALWGRPALAINFCYTGPAAENNATVAALRAYGPPVLDLCGLRPYLAHNSMSDANAKPGLHHDTTSGALHELNDAAIHALVSRFAHVTSPLATVQLVRMGGAAGRIEPAATAFAHRRAAYLYWITQTWTPGDSAARHTTWMRGMKAALAPHSTGGAYVNALGDEGAAGVRAAYPEQTYERLRAVKRAYDPTNLFRGNHNIAPGD